MRYTLRRTAPAVFVASLFIVLAAHGAENDLPVTSLLPGDGTVALRSTGLVNIKAALAETGYAKLLAEPEVQTFIKPPVDVLLNYYNTLRGKNAVLPDLADLDKAFAGELAVSVGLPTAENSRPAVSA